ncbi:MAG: bifunctional 5,10-methylenetetrahydrofolate dehydrogenase/5,10-methenyltetrahydrofolate cyclohydrolase [Syntrophomonadaceae bacterium]|nr:bifunctional 5,10-methylenetetrahydrofolate dehydrogenase/5,10-methenyltetrahydrofolate cyclohydrolase [Syntrophomonadaceae bacterium]
MLIYGKEIRDQIKDEIRREAMEIPMSMVILRVGEDPSSLSYVKGISKFAEETGVMAEIINLPENYSENKVIQCIKSLNDNPGLTGIMLQTPIPRHLNASRLVNAIDYNKDVEGIHNYNLGKLISREKGVKPATPKAVIRMLKAHNIALEGKKAVIIGRSMTVGSPLAVMMTAENCTVTICHSKTRDLQKEALNADILVAAIGKREFVTPDMVNENTVIIDVGINFDTAGKMFGDVHSKASAKAQFASAVPGGVGMITVAELFDNLSILSRKKV